MVSCSPGELAGEGHSAISSSISCSPIDDAFPPFCPCCPCCLLGEGDALALLLALELPLFAAACSPCCCLSGRKYIWPVRSTSQRPKTKPSAVLPWQ